MRYLTCILTFIFFFIFSISNGQDIKTIVIQEATPKDGLNSLAIHFYSIDFTKEQRLLINNVEFELIFLVDSFGKPTLKEVNGTTDKNIIDSLKISSTKIQNFNPKKVNGKGEESIYFLKLTFPSYNMTEGRLQYLQSEAFQEANLEDFEKIEKANSSFDIIFGGGLNQFIGNPSKHLKIGGGFKMDLYYTAENQYSFGLDLSFYGNTLKTPYIVSSKREQLKAPPTMFVGAIIGRKINKLSVNFELNAFVQNITEKIGENDKDWLQFKAWSPGLTLNYPIKIGKDIPRFQYSELSVYNNCINLNFGVKSLLLTEKQVTGLMFEFGLGYRLANTRVKAYKMKENWKKQK